VPQIQGVTDQPARRAIGEAQDAAEFGGCEVGDGGGAVPAQLDRVFGAGQPTLHHGVAGMQVGPMGGDLESADLGGDQGVFVGLGCSQGGCGIQLDQIIFEHAFNIWLKADILRSFDAPQHTDNTSRIRTTPMSVPGHGITSAQWSPKIQRRL
jgi:hypothetical protein